MKNNISMNEYVSKLFTEASKMIGKKDYISAISKLESAVIFCLKERGIGISDEEIMILIQQIIRETNTCAMAQLKTSVPHALESLRKAESWLQYIPVGNNLHSITYR